MLELIEDDYNPDADSITELYLTHLAGRCERRECMWCPEPGYSERGEVGAVDDGGEPP